MRLESVMAVLMLSAAGCTGGEGRELSDGAPEATSEGTLSTETSAATGEGETGVDDTQTGDETTGDPTTTGTETSGGEEPVEVELMVSSAASELGGTVTLSWVTSNAVVCAPGGGTAAWQAEDPVPLEAGSADVLMDITGELLFSLECEGAGGDVQSAEQAVQVACPSPEVAEGSPQPWVQYWNEIWPEQSIFQMQQILAADAYFSLSFVTGEVVGHGEIQTIQLTNGVRNVAVSECPGVFLGAGGGSDQNPCFERHANGQSLSYSTDGTSDCELRANTTYYLNVTYVDVENLTPDPSNCDMDSCQFNLNSAWVP